MRTLLPVALTALAACSRPATPPPLEILGVVSELKIGGAEEGPSSFGDIRAHGVDGAGRIYILDAQAQEVRLFDSAGAFLRRIGRRGAGPGEFRMANGITVDRPDRLWVYDPGNSRATVFDSAGVLVATHPIATTGYGYIWVGGIDSAGRLYDQQTMRVGDEPVQRLRRIDLTTGRIDTLPWPDCGAEDLPAYRFPGGFMQVPFAAGEYRRFDSRGFAWCADTRELRVQQYRVGDSVPLRVFTAAVDPLPVTAPERDSAEAQIQAFMVKAGTASVDYSLIPSTKPVLLALDVDDSGRLWARVQTRDGRRALVFDSGGHLIASAEFPFRTSPWLPLTIRGDRLYAVASDSLDMLVVERFRIARGVH